MKSFTTLAFLAFSAFASCVSLSVSAGGLDFVTERSYIISTVNDLKTTWTAHSNPRWETADGWHVIQRQLGALPAPEGKKLPTKYHDLVNTNTIPTEFDARTAWPQCESIAEIRDQSDCGSCWAFAAVEAGTDRICIATSGLSKPHLSATDLLSCCDSCGNGCDGGYPGAAWDWFTNVGVVTGGNYHDESWCKAYPFAICDHHVTGKYAPCSTSYPTPYCTYSCDSKSNYTVPYHSDKHLFASSYSLSSSVSQIQTEIMTHGPVEAAFTVYADFPSYKSGVYQYTTGQALGGHAVKILGWGVENSRPYWLVANSWNEDWGANGLFKILRGSNECGIEDEIVAGLFQKK